MRVTGGALSKQGPFKMRIGPSEDGPILFRLLSIDHAIHQWPIFLHSRDNSTALFLLGQQDILLLDAQPARCDRDIAVVVFVGRWTQTSGYCIMGPADDPDMATWLSLPSRFYGHHR